MSPLSPGRLLVLSFSVLSLLSILSPCESRRRVSQAQRAFDESQGIDWDPESLSREENEATTTSKGSTATTQSTASADTTTQTVTRPPVDEPAEETVEEDAVAKLLEGTQELANLTRLVEEEHGESLKDALNRTVLWIDASFKASDVGLNVSSLPECIAWRRFWSSNLTSSDESSNETSPVLSNEELEASLKETELVDSKKRLKKLGLNVELLEAFKAVGLVYKEICGEHGRELWFSSTEDAKRIGINEDNAICGPFKEALNPDAVTLAKLAKKLNEMIEDMVQSGNVTVVSKEAGARVGGAGGAEKREGAEEKEEEREDEVEEEVGGGGRGEGGNGTEARESAVAEPVGAETGTIRHEEHTEELKEEVGSIDYYDTEHDIESNAKQQATSSPTMPMGITVEMSESRTEEGSAHHRTNAAGGEVTAPTTHVQSEDGPHEGGTTDAVNLEDATIHVLEETADGQLRTMKAGKKTDVKKEKEEDGGGTGRENGEKEHALENTSEDMQIEEKKKDLEMKVQEDKEAKKDAEKEVMNYDDDIWDYEDLHRRFKVRPTKRRKGVVLRVKRETEEKEENRDEDDDWMKDVMSAAGEAEDVSVVEGSGMENETHLSWIEIDATDEINPALLISSMEAITALGLDVQPEVFLRYEKVGLYLPGICADYVPKAIDAFNSSSFEGIEIEGPIGVNISALEAAGVNLTALAEKLRNDTEVDDILSRTEGTVKTLGGSFILPVLNKNQYDPFSAPIVFQGSAVVVRFGIYIESMSNFQTSTMDYDMDIYLMMSWRDARLVNPYDKPILVKEEEILEKIWRPDPFFANAKEAEFHEVTFLNFLMRIYPDGLVLYETRVKITPSCNLILCKYPHDKQTCDLLIKSFAYPIETVRFEWFSRRRDAIDKNPDVKLPELYIDRYEPTICNRTRKSGAFSCLRAVFRLKRDVGFHIAQTYIPTSLALMFSWVGVWLPEEFMEGRIGVAITVLLTLSTESAGAREHLPSVSYLKAIDLWFGFITGFVFFTLLQTLFVIGFDKRANQMRKWATKKKSDVTEEWREAMLRKAKKYHKTGRYLDNFCRVFYPLSFLLFLIMYYFVFTEGRQDDCINRR